MMKPTYQCVLLALAEVDPGVFVARIVLRCYHASGRLRPGDEVGTSPLVSVDFERGIMITANSVYQFEPRRSLGDWSEADEVAASLPYATVSTVATYRDAEALARLAVRDQGSIVTANVAAAIFRRSRSLAP